MLQYLRVLILQVMSGKGLLHSYNHSPYRLICYCYISYVCFHGRKLLVFKWNLFFLNHIKKLYLVCKWLHSRQNISLGYFQSGVMISKTSQREGPGFESTIFLCGVYIFSPWLPPPTVQRHATSGVESTGDSKLAELCEWESRCLSVLALWLKTCPGCRCTLPLALCQLGYDSENPINPINYKLLSKNS